mmetsp:Transcript_8031/g.9325  ORF Transcript_8031/g.9325 Transcript_8031/m.9325 type:complete len:131 (+) Transcript_8031:136-528(+)
MKFEHRVSPLEKCSFAFHLILFPVGLAYLLWVVAPRELVENSIIVSYYPKKEYYAMTVMTTVSSLFLFFAAPLIFFAMNSFTVPELSSLDNIEDIHTRSSTIPQSSFRNVTGSLPEICDLDPTTLVWGNH